MVTQVIAGASTQRVEKQIVKKNKRCCLCEKIKTIALKIFRFFKNLFQNIGKKFRAAFVKKKTVQPTPTGQEDKRSYHFHLPDNAIQRSLELKQFIYRNKGVNPPENLPETIPAVERDASLRRVQQNGMELQHLDPKDQDSEEIVQWAVNQNWWARQFASPRLKLAEYDRLFNPKAQAIAKVQRSGILLGSKELEPFRDDRDVVTEAVKNSSYALQFASPRLENDPELREIARQTANRELAIT